MGDTKIDKKRFERHLNDLKTMQKHSLRTQSTLQKLRLYLNMNLKVSLRFLFCGSFALTRVYVEKFIN